MREGFKRKIERLKILTDSEIEGIHKATLTVLSETGCRFESERALKLLKKNGCKVDYETGIVKFSNSIVEHSLKQCPSSFYVKSRVPKDDLLIGGNTVYFMSSGGAQYVDIETGITREATMEENNMAVLVTDAIDTVDTWGSYSPYFEIKGIPPVMLCATSLAQRIRYSTKLSRGAQPTETYIWETQIAQAANMQIYGVCEAGSPLFYPKDATDAAFEYINAGFPLFTAAGGVMGGTAPVTVAGSLISGNAELIAAIVLAQLIKPGVGVMVNDFVSPMDMSSGGIIFGSLNSSLHQMAFNQIWGTFYNIPIVNVSSAFSNSKISDYQCCYEKLHLAMTSALSGANIIGLHGGVTAELSYNPILSIIDNDIANIIGKTIEGIKVDERTMAVNLINEVGPVPGTFLNKKHTRDNWKKEYYVPLCADRLSYKEWISTGKKTAISKAKEKYEEIIATHKPVPITSEQGKEINRILKEAKSYYKKKGLL